MVPSPCPVAPEVMLIHAASVEALHEHSRATLTDTVPVPPPAAKLGEPLVTVAWQRDAVGPATFVTGELPRPLAALAAPTANSRGRSIFTRSHVSSPGPVTPKRNCIDNTRVIRRIPPLLIAALAILLGSGVLISAEPDTTCAARGGTQVRWTSTVSPGERASIDRWCAGVGPPVRITGLRGEDILTGPFAMVSWNTHVGAGDLDRLVEDLRSGGFTGGARISQFVLPLQEAYRAGADVPGARRAGADVPGARRAGADVPGARGA